MLYADVFNGIEGASILNASRASSGGNNPAKAACDDRLTRTRRTDHQHNGAAARD